MKKTILLTAVLFLSFALFTPSYAAIMMPAGPGTGAKTTGPDSASVKNALAEFKSLSRKEKKERFKEVKKAVKDFKKQKRAGDADTNTLLEVILAILLPPLAVYLHEGEINNRFWISLILTLLFWIPGVIYALIIVLGDN
ncbi:YqaE/Pmp3 family membrane protein [Ferruginibacter sp.]